jgi:uncharacterized repeat protein (TIGR03803 family)
MIRTDTMRMIGGLVLALSASTMPALAGSDPYSVVYRFTGADDGQYPESGLITDGTDLYGTTFGSLSDGGDGERGKHCAKSCGNIYGVLDPAGTLVVQDVHSFQAGEKDGAFPAGEPLLSSDGTFYGTTEYGVATGCGGLGCGTVYEFSSAKGHEKTISFCRLANCADGAFPHAGLTAIGSDYYGTATLGGAGTGWLCGSVWGGCGVVYKVTSPTLTPIYSFCSVVLDNICTDGAVPYSGLLADEQSNLYGTTEFGGAYGQGTIFKLTPDGTETVLYSFCKQPQCADGDTPTGGLAFYNGDLYGTAEYGGSSDCDQAPGCGVVFKLSLSDLSYTVLYAFRGNSNHDGALPQATLWPDGQGSLYGTTFSGGGGACTRGGIAQGCGILFKMSASVSTPTVLHEFHKVRTDADGAHPQGALVYLNGLLYGTTVDRGEVPNKNNPPCECGTVYAYDVGAMAKRH